MARLAGLLIVVVWAVAFTALLARDVVPYWRAQELPAGAWTTGESQVGITDASGRRVGTCWLALRDQGELYAAQATTELTGLQWLRSLPPLPRVLLNSSFTFLRPTGRLEAFDLDLRREGEVLAQIKGQLIGRDYSCTLRAGGQLRHFSIDSPATATLAESLRPFCHLPDLHLGQTWSLQTLDVLALLRNGAVELAPRLATVTRREPIRHAGRRVDCFRIETDGAVAWADAFGNVLVQRVELPLLGAWELRDEPVDPTARQRATRAAAPRPRG